MRSAPPPGGLCKKRFDLAKRRNSVGIRLWIQQQPWKTQKSSGNYRSTS